MTNIFFDDEYDGEDGRSEYAAANEIEPPEQTELNAVQDWSNTNTLTPEGNLTVIDDVRPFNSSERSF